MVDPASRRKEQFWLYSPRFWLLAFVIINLIVGGFIATDYGESTDEYHEQKNASAAVQAYSFPSRQELEQLFTPTRVWHYYGTAQTAIFEAAEQTLSPILGTPANAIRHYGYFVSFQVGVVAIYLLVSVLASPWAALVSSILFGTQPLLFGHAFINYKDIPLLSIFTAVVAAGFHLSRKLKLNARLHPLRLPNVDWASAIAESKMPGCLPLRSPDSSSLVCSTPHRIPSSADSCRYWQPTLKPGQLMPISTKAPGCSPRGLTQPLVSCWLGW
jgi:hypothetical protein